MENEDFIRYVYNFIKRAGERFDWKGQFPKPDEIINDKVYSFLHVSIAKNDLPPELEFSKLPLILKELVHSELIGFNGKMESAKDPDNPKKRVPAYWVWLLQIVDIDEFLKTNGTLGKQAETFEIKLKDREVWINGYLLSKPYATGVNYEFLEYILGQPTDTDIIIKRKNLPKVFGALSLKNQLKGDRFKKAFTELGFKGQILKAFFKDRNQDQTTLRGKKITNKNLEDAGVNIPLFIKELEVAHLKNNPK